MVWFRRLLAVPGCLCSRIAALATPAPAAAVTGTLLDDVTEADIVTGGKTLVITLTGDTWVATVGADNAITQALIDGIDSAQAEATGWDVVVKAALTHAAVTRTSDTVVTITLPAFATFDITADETVTVTIPASAVSRGQEIDASTFSVLAVPILSNATDGTPTADGTTGASADTDVDSGEMLWGVVTDLGSVTNAQLEAGAGGDLVAGTAGGKAIDGTGTQVIEDITGLSASTTHQLKKVQKTAAGQFSNQTSVDLITTAALTVVSSVWTDNADGTATVDITLSAAAYCAVDYGTVTATYTASAYSYNAVTTWQATTAYDGVFVVPTTGNGFSYEATTGGTSGSSEPTWPTTIGETVVDGTVTWTCRSLWKNATTHSIRVPETSTLAADTYFWRTMGAVVGDPAGNYLEPEESGVITSYDADAQTIIDGLDADPGEPWKSAIEDFVVSARDGADPYWTVLAMLHCYRMDTESNSLFNWKNMAATKAATVSAMVWGAGGFVGDGTADYIDSNVPQDGAAPYARDDASFGVYNNGAGLKWGDEANTFILLRNGTVRINTNNASFTGNLTGTAGLKSIVRRSSTTSYAYEGDTQTGSDEVTASDVLGSLNFRIGALPSVSQFLESGESISFAYVASQLSAAQLAHMESDMAAFITAVTA